MEGNAEEGQAPVTVSHTLRQNIFLKSLKGEAKKTILFLRCQKETTAAHDGIKIYSSIPNYSSQCSICCDKDLDFEIKNTLCTLLLK